MGSGNVETGSFGEWRASRVREVFAEDHGASLAARLSAYDIVCCFEEGNAAAEEAVQGGCCEEGTDELGSDIERDASPGKVANGRECEGDGGVDMGSAGRAGQEDGDANAEAPNDGDLKETDLSAHGDRCGHASAAEENKEKGSDEFAEEGGAGFRIHCQKSRLRGWFFIVGLPWSTGDCNDVDSWNVKFANKPACSPPIQIPRN